MSKTRKSEKNLSEKKIKTDKNVFEKINLPKDLQKRVLLEKDPDTVMAEALENYYDGQKRRYENAVQKEIDNNIIEIQRRHISDLKSQLVVSNKNYEELMKTYQAYMLQVQPLIETAQLQKAAQLKLQEEQAEMKEEGGQEEKTEPEQEAESKQEMEKEETKIEMKKKKWYEFWK
jgi:spermidine/putrescine-binding protein